MERDESGGEDRSVIGRLKDMLTGTHTTDRSYPETVPRDCPHCDLPTAELQMKGPDDEIVGGNWLCPYCGNGSGREPERTESEAWERFMEKKRSIDETYRENKGRFE